MKWGVLHQVYENLLEGHVSFRDAQIKLFWLMTGFWMKTESSSQGWRRTRQSLITLQSPKNVGVVLRGINGPVNCVYVQYAQGVFSGHHAPWLNTDTQGLTLSRKPMLFSFIWWGFFYLVQAKGDCSFSPLDGGIQQMTSACFQHRNPGFSNFQGS